MKYLRSRMAVATSCARVPWTLDSGPRSRPCRSKGVGGTWITDAEPKEDLGWRCQRWKDARGRAGGPPGRHLAQARLNVDQISVMRSELEPPTNHSRRNAMGWKAPLLFTLRVPSNKTYRKNSAAWADVVASQQTRARLFEEPYRSVGVLTKAAS